MKSENCKLDGLLAVLVLKIGEGEFCHVPYIGLDLGRAEADDREHSNDKKSANLKKTAPTNVNH